MENTMLYALVASSCRRWRLTNDYQLNQVAREVGLSPATVHQFEHGRNNNASILLWYIAHGFDIKSNGNGGIIINGAEYK